MNTKARPRPFFTWLRSALSGLLIAGAVSGALADASPFKAMIVHPVGAYAYHTHDLDWG